jgi:hypothetical protein
VWRDEIAASRLGPTARAVACALATYMNGDGACWPSINTIAALLRLNRRTVQRTLRKLEADGFLGVERGGGRGKPSTYTAALNAALSDRGKRKRAAGASLKGGRGVPKGRRNSATRSTEGLEGGTSGRLAGAARPLDDCMGQCGERRPLYEYRGRLLCLQCIHADTGELADALRAHINELRAKT